MESTKPAGRTFGRRKQKTILWILFSLLFIGSLILLLGEIGPAFIGITMFLLSVADLVIIYAMTEKYYNWPMTFVLIFLIGLTFRKMHLPFSSVLLATGMWFLCITSLVNAIRFHFTERNNPFLRWFGSVSCIIISIYMFGMLNKIMHWSSEIGDALGYTGMVLFVISILGMVFTLPGSNYIRWSENEKKSFFRAVLVPMSIVFMLILLSSIFSDAFLWLIGRNPPSWEFTDSITLYDLEGLRNIMN